MTALPIAVDAMGGDRAPKEIVRGARQAMEAGIPVVLVGRRGDLPIVDGIEVIDASEVIEMHDDPAQGVRRKKDSSLVRAAEAVRDGRAAAMVSAGNTGATMASALLRMGRIKGVSRPAIATPIPVPGGTPTVLLDAGANAECQPEWLVQFAQMGTVFARHRFAIDEPKITGNVVLKTLEGGLQAIASALLGAFASAPEYKEPADALLPALLPLYETLDPDTYGGAMLLGVDGVCIISHGSSGARAIVNAIRVGREMVDADLVGKLRAAVTRD